MTKAQDACNAAAAAAKEQIAALMPQHLRRSTEEPPQWAKDKADLLAKDFSEDQCWRSSRLAFARYIAEHEDAPVDPLMADARKLVAEAYGSDRQKDAILRGEWCTEEVGFALAGIKRGIELAEHIEEEQETVTRMRWLR